MANTHKEADERPFWFVGATWDDKVDQTNRFLEQGIWENGWTDRFLDLVKSVQKGDRIAIKSSYTQKQGLPFDNRGNSVSCMAIKAVGIVKQNMGDGRTLKVNWTAVEPSRPWYFHTGRTTIWGVKPGDWMDDALIRFTFEGKDQDIDRFRNDPRWQHRFGDINVMDTRFQWTRFYEQFADGLLKYKDKRDELVKGIKEIAEKMGGGDYRRGMIPLKDKYSEKSEGPVKDICPFTVMAFFNRGTTNDNRTLIAKELAGLVGVTENVPTTFDGIPVVNNQNTWFFSYQKDRKSGDIDALWEVFAQAIRFAEGNDTEVISAFSEAYDQVSGLRGVGWKLSMGLYWLRPWIFPTLDAFTRDFISTTLKIDIGSNGPNHRCSASDYLEVRNSLLGVFDRPDSIVHSYPEISFLAWGKQPPPPPPPPPPLVRYNVDNICDEGCFIERKSLSEMLERLRSKRNVILQGPPGTGKTWLSKRLAYALIGDRDDSRLRALQFHPSLCYEDFVRGWRPDDNGKLALVDGPFLKAVELAKSNPEKPYVVVIEEINRGNPAQIFGELLTLLEADKRTEACALQLCYPRTEGERVYVPDNLYVIGTMNIADRSLALVDLALRRRFAFIDLEPIYGKPWHDWVQNRGIEQKTAVDLKNRIEDLNRKIEGDNNLGPQFRIGHSYFTPPNGTTIPNARQWFTSVVQTEIRPLLDEYWFDNRETSSQAVKKLLEGW